MRPVNQLPLSLKEMKRSPLASSRHPDSPPKPGKAEVRTSPHEPPPRMVAGVEGGNRPCLGLDRNRRRDREFVRSDRLRLRRELRPREARHRSERKPRRREFKDAAAADGCWHTVKNVIDAGGGASRAQHPGSR